MQSRGNLSDELVQLLRTRVVDGSLRAGERVNEVHVASELGVSRTPLREALSALVAEGALISLPRRGYFVQPLSHDEFEAICSIRPLLDPEALRRAGIPDSSVLERLHSMNEVLRKTDDVDARMELDDAWHLTLVAGCGNPVLLDLIRQFMHRTRRYEIAYLKENDNLTAAVDEHRLILNALRQGRLDEACAWLYQNMSSGTDPIRAWLMRRDAREARPWPNERN